jgi:hypothetical protein
LICSEGSGGFASQGEEDKASWTGGKPKALLILDILPRGKAVKLADEKRKMMRVPRLQCEDQECDLWPKDGTRLWPTENCQRRYSSPVLPPSTLDLSFPRGFPGSRFPVSRHKGHPKPCDGQPRKDTREISILRPHPDMVTTSSSLVTCR